MTPKAMMKSYEAWFRLATGMAKLGVAANEVVLRRTAMMATGAMKPHEATRMLMEKPAAFAQAAQKAAMAAAGGSDATAIATAALRPIKVAASANARRLRK